MKKVLVLLLVIWLQAWSQQAGRVSNLFLRAQFTPRAAALGNAFTAVTKDESSIFYNPAALAGIRYGMLALNHSKWFTDINLDNIIFSYNFDRKLGWALSLAHMSMPQIEGKDWYGQPTGALQVASSILTLGLGYKVLPSFYLGLNIKYFKDQLADYAAAGMAVDMGFLMHTAVRGLTVGGTIQNVGSPVQYDQEKEPLPITYRLGMAMKIPTWHMLLSLDVVKNDYQPVQLAVGWEVDIKNALQLRVGGRYDKAQDNFAAVYGAGISLFKRFFLNYTFYEHQDLGQTHRMGFTWRFNIPASRYTYGAPGVYGTTAPLRAPKKVEVKLVKKYLVIDWESVPNARYNVYVKTDLTKKWEKINRHPLYANQLRFKKPKKIKRLTVRVTALRNGRESAYSREVSLEVR